jgi:hypothetical protein
MQDKSMRHQIFVYGLILLAVLVLVFVCGCMTESNSLQSDKYVAIEEEMNDNGVLIAGTPGIPEAPLPPIFEYDNTIPRYSYPQGYPPMNDSLKILDGGFYTDSTPEYLRKSLNVRGIYAYPYQLESGPVITNIDRNGTIQMVYDNKSTYLKVNDEWTSPIITTRVANINGTSVRFIDGNVTGGNYTYTVKYTTTWKVTNRGLFEKSASKSS